MLFFKGGGCLYLPLEEFEERYTWTRQQEPEVSLKASCSAFETPSLFKTVTWNREERLPPSPPSACEGSVGLGLLSSDRPLRQWCGFSLVSSRRPHSCEMLSSSVSAVSLLDQHRCPQPLWESRGTRASKLPESGRDLEPSVHTHHLEKRSREQVFSWLKTKWWREEFLLACSLGDEQLPLCPWGGSCG